MKTRAEKREKIESILKYSFREGKVPSELWDILVNFIFSEEKTISNTFGRLNEIDENSLLRIFVEKASKEEIEKFILEKPPVFVVGKGYYAYANAHRRYVDKYKHKQSERDKKVLFTIMKEEYVYSLWHHGYSYIGYDAFKIYRELASKNEFFEILFMNDFLYKEDIYVESFEKIKDSLNKDELIKIREETFSKKLFEKITEILNN